MHILMVFKSFIKYSDAIIADIYILNHIIPHQRNIFVYAAGTGSTIGNAINTKNFTEIKHSKLIHLSHPILCTSIKQSNPSVSPQ